jgi:hypothetical protein
MLRLVRFTHIKNLILINQKHCFDSRHLPIKKSILIRQKCHFDLLGRVGRAMLAPTPFAAERS